MIVCLEFLFILGTLRTPLRPKPKLVKKRIGVRVAFHVLTFPNTSTFFPTRIPRRTRQARRRRSSSRFLSSRHPTSRHPTSACWACFRKLPDKFHAIRVRHTVPPLTDVRAVRGDILRASSFVRLANANRVMRAFTRALPSLAAFGTFRRRHRPRVVVPGGAVEARSVHGFVQIYLRRQGRRLAGSFFSG